MCIHTEQREKEIITEMKLKERRVIIEELANLNDNTLARNRTSPRVDPKKIRAFVKMTPKM